MSAPLVAIVEDEYSIRSLVAAALREEGFSTLEYDSGEAFMAELSTNTPLLAVFMDTDMGGRPGYAICKEVRQSHPSIRIIGTSGNPSDYSTIWKDAGAHGFIKKPYDLEQVANLLRSDDSLA